MKSTHSATRRQNILDAKLADLGLYAKELCPDGRVNIGRTQHDGAHGHVDLIVPPSLSEEEIGRVELALATRAGEIFDETGFFIPCAVLDAD
jgi:hypothetical protein